MTAAGPATRTGPARTGPTTSTEPGTGPVSQPDRTGPGPHRAGLNRDRTAPARSGPKPEPDRLGDRTETAYRLPQWTPSTPSTRRGMPNGLPSRSSAGSRASGQDW